MDNQLLGINQNGLIAGYFGSGAAGHPDQRYTLDSPYGQGNYVNENFPGRSKPSSRVSTIASHRWLLVGHELTQTRSMTTSASTPATADSGLDEDRRRVRQSAAGYQ
jgi:hypothetical protein